MKAILTILLSAVLLACVGLSVYATGYAIAKELGIVQPIDPGLAKRQKPF